MPSIEDWLNGLGLGKYSKVFAENDVDLRALPHLNGADLQELGVSLGHRKVMLAAIAELHTPRRRNRGRDEAGAAQIDRRSGNRTETKPAGEPGPDLRLLSVLFCDMVESTGLSARFSAEEMHDLIGAYQDTVATAIQRYGGCVAKFSATACSPISDGRWPMKITPSARFAPALRRLRQSKA